MSQQYYYSGARVKALETTLLSENQLERLLSAKSIDEAYKVLHDTFLSPYIARHHNGELPVALRKSLIDSKEMLSAIAPEPSKLNILWVRYDFYNLKIIVKGIRKGLSDEEILSRCYHLGQYAPEQILQYVHSESVGVLGEHFERAYRKAKDAQQVFEIDLAMNRGYLESIHELSKASGESFVAEFVNLAIDLFNLKTRLRILSFKGENVFPKSFFVKGGSIQERDFETLDQIYAQFMKFGGEVLWKEAIQEHQEQGHFSMIDKASDDYMVQFLKERSFQIFSLATLYSFFGARRNNVMVIKAIMTAKEAGVPEKDVRKILRRLYV